MTSDFNISQPLRIFCKLRKYSLNARYDLLHTPSNKVLHALKTTGCFGLLVAATTIEKPVSNVSIDGSDSAAVRGADMWPSGSVGGGRPVAAEVQRETSRGEEGSPEDSTGS